MLFNTLQFALFFACVYAPYLVLPWRAQNVLLLVASYFFYGCWDWRFLGLIALSTAIDYVCALRVAEAGTPRARRAWLGVSVATNLGILGFFKYFDFFAQSLQELARAFGLEPSVTTLNLVLPVGISFYTFQTLSYTIDVYRGRLAPCRDPIAFALFVAFFPQLVAGPIERAGRLLPQIEGARRVTLAFVTEGSWLILWGLFKKVFVADNLGRIVTAVYADPQVASGGLVLVAMYAFGIQIYCDFSGYSDMARGLAKVMGFDLVLNFRLPYFATNPPRFWKSWHISLTTWFHDYVYAPLTGGGLARGAASHVLLTMGLVGLWHGANWTYVAWGLYFALLILAHRSLLPLLRRVRPTSNAGRNAWFVTRVVVLFHLLCLGGILFRATSLSHVLEITERLLFHFEMDAAAWSAMEQYARFTVLLFAVQVAQFRTDDMLVVLRAPWYVAGILYFVLYYCVVVYGVTGGQEFIYFQF
jgi:alginate O-acetyltransferase complex protein AlgI